MRGQRGRFWRTGRRVTWLAVWLLALTTAGALALAGSPAAPASAEGPNAIVNDPGCFENVLPGNDDGSSPRVTLPFAPNFFGQTYGSLWVNNNGNVTFTGPLSTFTPFGLLSARTPIIAPYFGDVDTRNVASGRVQYGGHDAFCVNWVNVGYYSAHVDKLNSFQLLLVDRSDVGPGDFDIVFNYDKVQWETGDASGGAGGLGGQPARAGYSNGTTASFELPGSGVSHAFLDSSPGGLIHGSRDSLQLGRYVFPVRNGAAPTGGSIAGHVWGNAVGSPLFGAFVMVCGAGGGCNTTTTNTLGEYSVSGLPPDSYNVTAFPPGGSTLGTDTIGPLAVGAGTHLTNQDLLLTGPLPPPPDTTILPSSPGGGVPVVYWHNALTLTTQGCVGGTASYTLSIAGVVVRSGPMAEGPPGTYTATIAPLFPLHGEAEVQITINCPDPAANELTTFNIYIDPSGVVQTTGGAPIVGATVTLLRSDSAVGPFLPVPDGSGVMSPANRTNPMLTNAAGEFGWDVIAGYYVVRATATGCHAPGNPLQLSVETGVLPIPPPTLGLVLVMECAGGPPTITNPGDQASAEGDVISLPIVASDPDGDPLTFSATGLPASLSINPTTGVISGTLGYTEAGTYTVTVSVTDGTDTASASFNWVVANTNRPPVVTNPGNQSNWTGDVVSLQIVASDPDGDPIQYDVNNPPAGVLIAFATGLLAGTTTAAGDYAVTVSVHDGMDTTAVAFRWVVLDPLEAFNRFDVASKDVQVFGRNGGAGAPFGPVAPSSVVPVPWPDDGDDAGEADADEDADDDEDMAEQRTYVLTDPIGRSLTLVEIVKREGHSVHVIMVSVQRHGGAMEPLPRNSKKFEWSANKDGTLKELEQKLSTGSGPTKQQVKAKYEAKKNETTVTTKVAGGGETKQTLPGLVLLRMAVTPAGITIGP